MAKVRYAHSKGEVMEKPQWSYTWSPLTDIKAAIGESRQIQLALKIIMTASVLWFT